jgi:hypothetical protein
MKLAMLAAVALAGLMEEATDGTTGSAGATAEDTVPPVEKADTAPNVADTSGDVDHQPPGAHLDRAAQAQPEGEVVPQAEPVETDDEYANALAAGKPRVALVGKYSDRIPVQLKSKDHLAQLQSEHGGAVEVLS